MPVRADDRAVSPLLGAILLAGILVLGLSVVQTQTVPGLNEAVEFDHNQRVTGDMERLQSAIVAVGATGASRTITIELGTSYPRRFVLRNPAPDPSGALATGTAAAVVVNNTTAGGEAGDYWNGSRRNFSTRPLVYEPNYNHLDDAPTTRYENTVVYNQFADATVTLAGGTIVDGRRITVLALAGNLSVSRAGEESVSLRPVSTAGSTLSVTNETGERVTLSFPTRLANATWADLLEPEYAGNGGHVVEQSYRDGTPYNRLVLTLEQGVTYELRLAKVGVGTGVPAPGEHYITFARKPDATVGVGTSHRVVVEVRDRFNNPVSGVGVDASPADRFADASLDTDADGRATFEYTASGGAGTDSLAFDISATPTAVEEATVDVTVTADGGGSAIEPAVTDVRVTVSATGTTVPDGGDVQQGTNLTLTATINDTGRGGSDVIDALWRRTDPDGVQGSANELVPVPRGSEFDSPIEDVINGTVVDTSGWASGLHTISFRGKDGEGQWGEEQHDVTIVTPTNQAPTAEFTASRLGGSNNVDLDGTPSSDPDGAIASYEWDIDDDGTFEETGQTVSGANVPPGTDVTLRVTDDGGKTDSVTKTVS